MKEYEVIREIFDSCSGKWEVDSAFTREITCENIDHVMQSWFHGKLPEHAVNQLPDGAIAYVMDAPLRERYSFSEC